jgi:hypothetical protein
MNIYKKMLLSLATVALVTSGSLFARCQTCAEKMAIKQSIKEALAASIAAGKPSANKPSKHKEIDTIEDVQSEPCCASCATGGECDSKKCPCNDPRVRAERQSITDNNLLSVTDETAQLDEIQCLLEKLTKKSALCCRVIHHIEEKVKEQGHDARRCCRHIRHELDDIEELIVSQIDQTTDCCSVTETLLLSQIDQQAICCSITESLILSQIDQQAICCSIIETTLGDPCSSVVDILDLLTLPVTVVDVIDTTCLDTITLLKSIYALLTQIWFCTCNVG